MRTNIYQIDYTDPRWHNLLKSWYVPPIKTTKEYAIYDVWLYQARIFQAFGVHCNKIKVIFKQKELGGLFAGLKSE